MLSVRKQASKNEQQYLLERVGRSRSSQLCDERQRNAFFPKETNQRSRRTNVFVMPCDCHQEGREDCRLVMPSRWQRYPHDISNFNFDVVTSYKVKIQAVLVGVWCQARCIRSQDCYTAQTQLHIYPTYSGVAIQACLY